MRGAEGISKGGAASALRAPSKQAIVFDKARRRNRFQLVRPSLGVKIGVGSWLLDQGALLEGVLVEHPVNIARKIIIRTNHGTFSLNEEDVQKL